MQAAGVPRALHPPVVDDWQGLSLDYAVPAPLHLLLTPQASCTHNLDDPACIKHVHRCVLPTPCVCVTSGRAQTP